MSAISYLRFAAKFWGLVLVIVGPPVGSLALTALVWGDPWDIFVALFWVVVLLPFTFATGHLR